MNKKLLTAAIGAALAAGPMLAQADVKLYGRAHVSVDYLDAKASTSPHANKSTTVSSNASRWGIDVSEKLGGGMTAFAKIENDVRLDGDTPASISTTGSTQQLDHGARNRFVGLKGKFGSILAGVNDTPFKDIRSKVDLFGDQVGDMRNMVTVGSYANSSAGWDLRTANAVKYGSPNMNGFSVEYQYSADRSAVPGTEDNRNRVDSLALIYSKGPLYVAYANESHRLPRGGTTTVDSKVSETGNRLGASYSFGAFKLVGLYENFSDLGGTVSGATAVSTKAWALGGAYTAGNNVFKAQYAKVNKLNNTSTGASADNTGAKMWVIGWDHLFSKTTKAYIAYAKTDNESASALMVNGPSAGGHSDAVAPGTGLDPSVWSVGMILDF